MVVGYQYCTALDLLIYLFSLTLTYGSTIFNLFGLRNFLKVKLISAWIFVHINLKILPKTSNSYDHLATAPLQGKEQIFIVSRFHPTMLDPREQKHFIHSWNRTQVLLLPRKASDHTILSQFHHTTILGTPLDPRGGKTLRQSGIRTQVILQSKRQPQPLEPDNSFTEITNHQKIKASPSFFKSKSEKSHLQTLNWSLPIG